MPKQLSTFFLLLCCLSLLPACKQTRPLPYSENRKWTAWGEDRTSRFGFRACFAGDVNGDGYSDLVIGAPGYDHSRGKVYVYFGGPQGLPAKADWTFEGEAPGDSLGDRVGAAGDVNGDGVDDLYVSASGWHQGFGKLYVFYGSRKGLGPKPDWVAQGSKPGELFGDCTVPTGDLNGDGIDDLAVGSFGFDNTRGKVSLFLGSKGGLLTKPVWTELGEKVGDQFGYGLGPVGDLRGKGTDDLLICSKYNSQAVPRAGKAYLYLGSSAGPRAATWQFLGTEAGANLGTRAYGLGFQGLLGAPVLALAAPYAKDKAGEVYLFKGSAQGLDAAPLLTLSAGVEGLQGFGFALGPLPGLAGAKKDGFFVGANQGGWGWLGIYTLEKDPAGNLRAEQVQVLKGRQKGDRFATWAAPAGDVNGDGVPDLCVSSDAAIQDGRSGRVDVYYGTLLPNAKPTHRARLGYFVGGRRDH